MKTFFVALFLCLCFPLTGCTTPSERFGSDVDTSETSHASGDAYVTDAMSPRKWEPIREPTADPFFYKNCEQLSDKTYFSMTSYECSEH
jgi:hypothetical protein